MNGGRNLMANCETIDLFDEGQRIGFMLIVDGEPVVSVLHPLAELGQYREHCDVLDEAIKRTWPDGYGDG